ncbi:hypothetical protein MRX96_018200 [Rhipicephalus microplus]
MKGPPRENPESRAEVAEEGGGAGEPVGAAAWRRLARRPLAELGRAGSMAAAPAGSRTGRQQQGQAGPGGPGGGRRRRCGHDGDRGPMTSSAGGDDRAGHAAGGRRRAKQRIEL